MTISSINPPGQAAPEDEDIEVRQEPEEDAQRNHALYRLFAADTGGKPGHRSPEQRVMGQVQHGEDQGVDAMLCARCQ